MTAQAVRLVFLVVGVVALGFCVRQTLANLHLLRAGETATGQLSGSGHPDVTFTTAAGQTIRYRQNGYTAATKQDTATVLFDPADPTGTATLAGFWTMWLPVILALVLGASGCGLALASFFL